MKRSVNKLALYTTIYPGVEPYLSDWYRSVRHQTDQDFQLWIGLDALHPEAAQKAMEADPAAVWMIAEPGDTPAQIRQRALKQIVDVCDAAVLVDSDDVLHPSRVAAARAALQQGCDLYGCSLRLVDRSGRDLGVTFGLPEESTPDAVLPRNNAFGLSNSAFRSDLLRRCLPIPAEVELVDWYLATRAWLHGSRMAFDPQVHMDYRQHDTNMARVLGPFTPQQIVTDTERVLHHFEMLLASRDSSWLALRATELELVAADVGRFHRRVVLRQERLDLYIHDLNALNPTPLWWACVAHPSLRQMWTS